ncbi:hypothetical protein [Glycomyces harbinensis]|uniref:Uncharacterized protein n=1 Tax=Glycomyces harbinensis TaxID=58114 RepID=A0A1G7AMB5_9ACTN|nr:hypothetical protein [Glycomyces harbinensis]SDE15850.1 hypothetical protein SAMN05216270_11429 [Glycomyces harbinensis]
MPKAAAIQPLEWATIHPGFGTFDIGELNRVVLDYAYIELHMASRWTRRSALGRVFGGLLYSVVIIGLMAAVTLGLCLVTGVDGVALVPIVYVGTAFGCAVVAGLYVPWALTPYRQWDRTLCGISVMIAVIAVVSIGSIFARDFEAAPRWLLAAPCAVMLIVAIGAIVGDYRFRTTVKPPAVDVKALSPEEVDVLLAVRRRVLKSLRAKSIVSYSDFKVFDAAPLDSTGTGQRPEGP